MDWIYPKPCTKLQGYGVNHLKPVSKEFFIFSFLFILIFLTRC